MRILTGIEVDILEDGSLDQDAGLLERLDVVVASVHSKLSMDSPAMTRRMLAPSRTATAIFSAIAPDGLSWAPGSDGVPFDPDAIFDRVPRARHRRRDQFPAGTP